MATINCTLGRADCLVKTAEETEDLTEKIQLYTRSLQIYTALADSNQESGVRYNNAIKSVEIYNKIGDIFAQKNDSLISQEMYDHAESYIQLAEGLEASL